jgi:hypothetical protein
MSPVICGGATGQMAGLGSGFHQAAVTPTTDTNTPERCCAPVDAGSASRQATDSAEHVGHALQAGDLDSSPLAPPQLRQAKRSGSDFETGD